MKTILKKDNNNLGPAYSVKLVFSCVVKGIKIIIKMMKKFCASRCLHFIYNKDLFDNNNLNYINFVAVKQHS